MTAAKAQMLRWGNSLAVRIPKYVAEEAHLKEGDALVLEVLAQGSVALKVAPCTATLEELLSQINSENVHGECEWGDRVGAEAW
jgi:antitoxin MazE